MNSIFLSWWTKRYPQEPARAGCCGDAGVTLRICSLIGFLILSACSNTVQAEQQGVGSGARFIAVETLIAVASYAAAESPKAVGIGAGLLVPMAAYMDQRSSTVTRWTGVIVAESIAYYNIRADGDDDISKDDILKKNFIGWNIFALTVGLSDYFFPAKEQNNRPRGPQLSLRVDPATAENSLQLSYRF